MNKRITKKVETRLGHEMYRAIKSINPVSIHLNSKGQITNWDDLSNEDKEGFLEDFNDDKDYSHRSEKYPALTDLEHYFHRKPVKQSDLYPNPNNRDVKH